ncbi:hypothetical protein Peur_013510 [Populus x canadensis]
MECFQISPQATIPHLHKSRLQVLTICADELGSVVEGHDEKKLKFYGGVNGVAEKLCTSMTDGLTTANSVIY